MVREVKEVKEVKEFREIREREEEYAPSGGETEHRERGIRATLGRGSSGEYYLPSKYCPTQRGLSSHPGASCFRNLGAKHTNTQKHAQTGCVPMCAMCILCAPNSHKINFVHSKSHPRA